MTADGIGVALRRKEDKRFLTGKGRYTADIDRPGQLHACFVRAPEAHAAIVRVDAAAALAMPGVVAVLTGEEAEADKLGRMPCGFAPDGEQNAPPRPALCRDRVRFVGDLVALVVAERLDQARDAAEAVEVDYRALPVCVDPARARDADAPLLHDQAPRNTCRVWQLGNAAETDAAFAGAHHVAKIDLINNRKVPNAIEPRATLADYDSGTDSLTVYTTSQNPHITRLLLAAFVLGMPEHKVRIVSPDIGGGFGSKIPHYPEEALVAWASRRLVRPVKWVAERSESFMADAHGRDHITHAELALDRDGRFLALRADTVANLGAYLSTFGALSATYLYATLLSGQYKIPAIHATVTVFTGSQQQGQGHETAFAQVVADRLGTAADQVEIVHGDTGMVQWGHGTYGSRSLAVGGSAIVKACDRAIEKGKKVAAHLMEASEADIEFADGIFTVAGTDRTKSFGEVVAAAMVPHNFPLQEMEPGLDQRSFYDPANFTYPAGCHVCELEVDPDTGVVEIVRFIAVDDFGTLVNPMIVEGQVHGGIGQALYEGCLYDRDSGQLVTGSYMDYAMPHAKTVPSFEVGYKVTPCPHNPLGVKGCGEAGAIAAPAAVINALTDAIGTDIQMPATPPRVWAALRSVGSALAAE